ncbi:pyridoxamine 5'-phosphate oxidase [Anaplasma capra]|uniref:pyridoxamine 5'-phosphate oxidase n=1 Tax=Anaplasma capra TaxID=1562740 RepID=UPI0021D6099E|nr:pyridoxamine 5'-phosphate oxidase [Anaplasma capra]MCU7611346.1 pyridoxamine 5'-phosphate oxidase [Anaplasma capra]MCU7612420.1 pyridoxamine 5'-phosphate oxidase [Anaplasma capra]
MPFSGACVQKASSSPMDVFSAWYSEMLQATESHMGEPAAMVLATCDVQGKPSARVVLLKKYGKLGFEFFTNFESRKGKEIAGNPNVALVFDWRHMGRQVRVEGSAVPLSASESDAYHASRSRESRIGALCSKQSMVLNSREELLAQFNCMLREFEGKEIPRPEYWGGIRVVPRMVEFWEEGEHRLHSRKQYSMGDDGAWSCAELYP